MHNYIKLKMWQVVQYELVDQFGTNLVRAKVDKSCAVLLLKY